MFCLFTFVFLWFGGGMDGTGDRGQVRGVVEEEVGEDLTPGRSGREVLYGTQVTKRKGWGDRGRR